MENGNQYISFTLHLRQTITMMKSYFPGIYTCQLPITGADESGVHPLIYNLGKNG
jgi:hypothetical protein